MKSPTVFLARLLGLFLLIVGIAMEAQRETLAGTAMLLVHDQPLLLLFAMLTALAGLAIVLGHNVWKGGVLPVVVTLVGWVTLLKGIMLLFLPSGDLTEMIGWMHSDAWVSLHAILPIALGLYLTWAGFKPRPAGKKK
jgi:hypothetical protein